MINELLNKFFKLVFIGVTSLILFSCSSSTTETHYFLLMNNVAQETNTSSSENKQYNVSVEIPEYLKKPYIAMQLGENQIHYSLFNLWAEPLQQGIKKALIFDLNQSIFPNKELLITEQIRVKINYFHATENSKVILSGYFSIKGKLEDNKKPFYFEMTLEKDGFSHSISKMRKLIGQLSFKISSLLI